MLTKLSPTTSWHRSRSASLLDTDGGLRLPSKSTRNTIPDDRNLTEFNACLSTLAAVFPDVRTEVFREMLSTFSDVSRLQLVAESLLKNKAQWVQGRWRVPEPVDQAQLDGTNTDPPPQERFRTTHYRAAVKATLYQEFRGLSHASIKAVLAEHNHSYTATRQALLGLSQQSWRYSLAKMLFRRKTLSDTQHPLIEWRIGPNGARVPGLTSTNCAELDQELVQAFLAPLLLERIKDQVENDRQLAEKLNEDEAEQANAMFDCECCFMPHPFESITICDIGGHFICSSCIRHTINEAVYGQGWSRSVDVNRCLLKCVAPSSTNGAECTGCISREDLRRALAGESAREDILTKLDERVARESLSKARLSLLKCPFCVYAEFEDVHPTIITPKNNQHSVLGLIIVIVLGLCGLDLVLDINKYKLVCVTFMTILASFRHLVLPKSLSRSAVVGTPDQKHHGRRFACRSPSCARISCLTCLSPWTDIHVCFQSSRQALRTYVESAVTEAIKRTCPQCNLAFVKSSGCNKLVCVCGYTMCYICRSEIGAEGYAHFCQHFRPVLGQSCRECNKCDLYQVEDEEVVIRRAKDRAVKEWKEREGVTQANGDGAAAWNAEEEADGVGQNIVSRQNTSWL